MTEEEAKKLRCCGPCPKNTGIPTYSKILREGEAVNVFHHLCSGSECMAWKWEYPECEDRTLGYCCYMRR